MTNEMRMNDLRQRPGTGIFSSLFLLSILITACQPAEEPFASEFQVEEATISEIHEAMEAGQLTAVGLVDSYLARIEAYDKQGSALNAIILVNPQARQRAAELDEQFALSGLTGPLHGNPDHRKG